MRFSIIVVSLNPGERLKKTINSIQSQTFTDYEIVIKDGGSKDGSIALYEHSLDERIKFFNMKDSSIYDAMNQAVEKCSGDYYIFLNCGDIFENDTVLEDMNKYMSNNKGIYYGDLKREDTEGIIASPRKITDFVCYRNIPCHQVCFYRRDLFSERGYELKYPVRADYEHFLYCRYERHQEMIYVPVTVCLYEGEGFSETKEHEKAAKKEHKEITAKYLKGKCILYKLIMILTLQPLRKLMSKSGFYQRIRGVIYGKV